MFGVDSAHQRAPPLKEPQAAGPAPVPPMAAPSCASAASRRSSGLGVQRDASEGSKAASLTQ